MSSQISGMSFSSENIHLKSLFQGLKSLCCKYDERLNLQLKQKVLINPLNP